MTRAVGGVLVVAVLLAACSGGHAPEEDHHGSSAVVPGIETAQAELGPLHDVYVVAGSVMGDAEPAEVRDARRTLIEAAARARAATEQATRLESLARGAIAPKRELEAARAEAAAAGAAADRARQTLAAFGTVVEQQPLAPGERWVLGQVPQAAVDLVIAGAAVVFRPDGFPGREFVGTIDAPASYVDPSTRTAPVRTRVRDEARALRPGMSGGLALTAGAERSAVTVPTSAIVYDGAQPVVFIQADHGIFAPRAVRLGVAADARVEVIEGVAAGATVVTTGAASLLSSTRLPGEAD